MNKAIESIEKTIENIEKELEFTLIEDRVEMLERAKQEAMKCLNTLRYINQ